MKLHVAAVATHVAVCLSSGLAWAHGSETSTVTGLERLRDLEQEFDEEIIVRGRAQRASTADIVLSRDLLLRPLRRPADLLEVTPGLKVVQHAGGGKANQYFIRGFDIDHGTDLLLTVDGVPVNNVSHGHGQGYADLHFVIPELVDRVEVKKGPYYAEVGDFATAGAVNMVNKHRLGRNTLGVTVGMFETYRALAMISPDLGNESNVLAGEFYTSDGPFENGEDLQRFNLVASSTFEIGESELDIAIQGYDARWNANGQIPDRLVRTGALDRFGSIDPTEGGNSRRFTAQARFSHEGPGHEFTVDAYLVRYELQLYSNFTFFSRDEVNGDMIEQTDERFIAGGEVAYAFDWDLFGISSAAKLGLQTRNDFIENGLFYGVARRRLSTVVTADVMETSVSAYAKNEFMWTSWLRTELGLRGDFFNFQATTDQFDGSVQAGLLSPKVNVVITPVSRTDIFLRFGQGFHSNDARGAVQDVDPVEPLTRATGAEVGVRSRLFDRLDVGVFGFWLDLDSEIVFVGDEGTTEASGATRRLGLEVDLRFKFAEWLFADADLTLTQARFVDAPEGEDRIPLAPRLTFSAGVSAIHPSGVFGRVSFFYIADRPANEDEFVTALGYGKLDATLGFRNDIFELAVSAQNLLDADVREAQFATTSRLLTETSAASCPEGTRGVTDDGTFAGCEDLHFTPGLPISFNASMSVFF
ncbi:MAG: TonB-dependent receptor [Myxococcota bacterium]